jgi:very-short-patch-repair endonuclease
MGVARRGELPLPPFHKVIFMRYEVNVEYTDYEIEFLKIIAPLKVRFFTQEWISISKGDEIKNYKADVIIKKAFYPQMKADHGIIFEVQGEQHLKKGRQRKDEEKIKDLTDAGYHVYEVWFYELKDREKLKDRIINILKEEGILK